MLAEEKLENEKALLKQVIYQELLERHQEKRQRFLQTRRKVYLECIRTHNQGGQPLADQNYDSNIEKQPSNDQFNRQIYSKFKSKYQQTYSNEKPTLMAWMLQSNEVGSSQEKQVKQHKQAEQIQEDVKHEKGLLDEVMSQNRGQQEQIDSSQDQKSVEQKQNADDDDDLMCMGDQDQIYGDSGQQAHKNKKKLTSKKQLQPHISIPKKQSQPERIPQQVKNSDPQQVKNSDPQQVKNSHPQLPKPALNNSDSHEDLRMNDDDLF